MTNSPSISALYRRSTEGAAAAADAAAVLEALEKGPAAPEAVEHLARSAEAALVARLLVELGPESEALAADVARLRAGAAGEGSGHRPRTRLAATRAGGRWQRPVRWLGATAASIALVAAGMLLIPRMQPASFDTVVAGANSIPLPDRIFTDRDRIFAAVDDRRAGTGDDALFHADFGGS